MNITETAKLYAAQIGPEIDAHAARAAQTPSGSWPGSVERDNTRRLRTAIATELIDERLRDLIRAYDADDATDQLDLHSRAIVTELSEDLAAYCERLEGSKT